MKKRFRTRSRKRVPQVPKQSEKLEFVALQNGLRIAWLVTPGTGLVHMEYMTRCGGDAEGPEGEKIYEAAHAIEHLIAGWTSNMGVSKDLQDMADGRFPKNEDGSVNEEGLLEMLGRWSPENEVIQSLLALVSDWIYEPIEKAETREEFNLEKSPTYLMARILDATGTTTNAVTEDETVRYWLGGLAKYQHLMGNILASSIEAPLVEEEIYEQEMHAAISELTSIKDSLWYPFDNAINKYAYKGTSRAAGEEERIENLQRFVEEDEKEKYLGKLKQLIDKWYSPENLLVFVAGDLSSVEGAGVPDVVAYLEGRLKRIPSGKGFQYKGAPTVERKKGGLFECIPIEGVDSAKVVFFYPVSYTIFDLEAEAALKCIAWLLEEGFSGRLVGDLRTKRGVIYDVKTELFLDHERGPNSNFRVVMECKEQDGLKISDIVEIAEALIEDLCKRGPHVWEMEKWRQNVYRRQVDDLADLRPEKYALHYTKYLAHGNVAPTKQLLAEVSQGLTSAQVQSMACKSFNNNPGKVVFSSSPEVCDTLE